ncbi:MAG: hypothetical protein R3F33_16400 [Planctomycetota bacterium]
MTSLKQIGLLSGLGLGLCFVWVPGMRNYLPDFITGATESSTATSLPEGVTPELELIEPGQAPVMPRVSVSGGDPAALLESLRNFRAGQGPGVAPEPAVAKNTPRSAPDPGLRLQQQVRSLSLSAILVHPGGSRVLFGAQSYRLGQEVLPGVRVESIAPEQVVLGDGQSQVTLSLPILGQGPSASFSATKPPVSAEEAPLQ